MTRVRAGGSARSAGAAGPDLRRAAERVRRDRAVGDQDGRVEEEPTGHTATAALPAGTRTSVAATSRKAASGGVAAVPARPTGPGGGAASPRPRDVPAHRGVYDRTGAHARTSADLTCASLTAGAVPTGATLAAR